MAAYRVSCLLMSQHHALHFWCHMVRQDIAMAQRVLVLWYLFIFDLDDRSLWQALAEALKPKG